MTDDKPWYLKGSNIARELENFKSASKEKTSLDTKTKELIKFAVSSVFRCTHCTDSHMKKALAAGATKEEVTEALLLSSVQAAATQMNWNKEAFEKYLG